ncbi:MAG TPA: hypothetical protein H9830_00360 [Candidatus Agrococcus pullicola]|uniref:Uncharacterized protein n=1 Tax=Candidatus Agrococcus pullicola TaxID=2838429 RepID=A0A9D2C770_9MICO|nr:hypothetical protein [Candidatus Agrococcus pullicola]
MAIYSDQFGGRSQSSSETTGFAWRRDVARLDTLLATPPMRNGDAIRRHTIVRENA